MWKLSGKSKPLAIFVVLFGVLACVPLLSGARAPATTITIINNSNREIRHVYLSPADQQNNWGPDQLVNSVIPPGGGSFTMSNVTCEGQNIRVIAEDHEGCFLYRIVTCSEPATWTITNDATPDCGG